MGRYETRHWASDAEAPTARDRKGGSYHPYVPDMLTGRSICLSADAAQSCEKAAVALRELDGSARYTRTAESLSRVLLRSEAISSSRIEGLEMNARRLLELEALDELHVPHRNDSTEAQVLGNISSMYAGIEQASQQPYLQLADVLAMHEALLAGTRLSEYGGVLRHAQNWIGGSWYQPIDAAYVPPRPELVETLMDDLISFINTSNLPAIAIAATAHAQIETIHPFVDGNGRTGRALTHVVMRRTGLAVNTICPVSLVLATRKQQYVHALELFRFDEEAEPSRSVDEAVSGWTEFFANALVVACDAALAFENRIDGLYNRWLEKVSPRKNSAAELLLQALPGNPVVSIASAARLTGRSYPAARGAVRHLEEKGILVQNSKNRKSGLYVANDVLDEFVRYERSLATIGGDTRIEKPRRPVPQRP